MRWPWVSRAMHDEVVAILGASHDRLVAALERRDDDVRTVLELVRETRQAPLVAEPVKSPYAALGPKTHAALATESRGLPPEIRRGMQAKALALHEQKMSDDDIAAAIYRGEPVNV